MDRGHAFRRLFHLCGPAILAYYLLPDAFLFFEPALVACAVCGLCWVDPMIGEMRRRGLMGFYPAAPLLAYFLIAFTGILLLTGMGWILTLCLPVVGSVSAISVERRRLPVDDDFTMLVVPLVAMSLASWYLGLALGA
jgi:hypothetical protein